MTCTRALEFDAGHRLVGHKSKCANIHGHRYRLEVTCIGKPDKIGVIIDFAEVKGRVGRWLEDHLDHGMLVRKDDAAIIELCKSQNWRMYILDENPTAENLAVYLLGRVQHLLKDLAPQITVQKVRLYETPNCWADATVGAV